MASVDLVLEFNAFRGFWAPYRMRAIDARDGMARSPVSAPQPWSAAVRLRRGRMCYECPRLGVSALVPAPSVPASVVAAGSSAASSCVTLTYRAPSAA